MLDLRRCCLNDLNSLHLSLGMWIRYYFGLWKCNFQLMIVLNSEDPDEASSKLIRLLWVELNKSNE